MFVVPERNVVTRPVFLDQFAFEQDRFRFTADDVRLEIPRCLEHGVRFQIRLREF